MKESMIIAESIIRNTWIMLSSIEVLDLGFSFAEMIIGILFFILLLHIIKVLIFGGNMAVGSLANTMHGSIASEAAAAKQAEYAQMHRDREIARKQFNTLRESKRFNPNFIGPSVPRHLKPGLDTLDIQKDND